LGGKPAFSQADGKGHVYANIETAADKQEIVEITAKDSVVSKRYSTAPCDDRERLGHRSGENAPLYGLRQQNDDRQRSCSRQGSLHSGNR
jgi:hypothetical protein